MKRSLRSWLWRVPLEREVDEELELHVELRTRELVARGVDERIAREMALARLGDRSRLTRTCVDLGRKRDREMRLTQWIEEVGTDIRFALRQLRASPAFTCIAALTLALGIGANSAIFALADAALLRPLPFTEPERLVMVWERRAEVSRGGVNPLDFVDWTERNRTFTALAAVMQTSATISGKDGPSEPLPSQAVTLQFFDVFALRPIAGRTFVPDDLPDRGVVVLSEGFWRRQFGGDPATVGRQIRMGGEPFTIIGIVPDVSFVLPRSPGVTEGPNLWTLLDTPADRGPAERYAHYFRVVGRLRPGVSLETAQADMTAIAEAIARETPTTNAGHGVFVEPLRAALVGPELRLTSWLLLGVVGFVLMLCCANVANLVLARTTTRVRELAVRSALGAGRQRIVRQLLTESVVLAGIGGAAGGVAGAILLQVAPTLMPPGLLPAAVPLAFDVRVLVFCAAASAFVAIACGLIPAWRATSVSLTQAVAVDGRTSTLRSTRLASVVAAAEVAVALFLLCGAGLLLRTLAALNDVDSGAGARNVLTMNVAAGMSNDLDYLRQYYEAVEREVRTVPGVSRVTFGSALPFGGVWYGQNFDIDGEPPRPEANRTGAGYQIVGASYFETLDIPILAGRGFDDRDHADAVQVCVVDDTFVQRYLQGREPIGTRLVVNAMASPPRTVLREIVGVVRHVKERPDELEPQPFIYVPLAQNPWWAASLVVRPKEGDATALTSAVRTAVARVNRDRPPAAVRTLSAIQAEATARPRFRAILVGTFAGLALLLAVIGVFGVLAYSVEQRTREFGVRIALGASAGSVLRMVFASAGRMVMAGALVGLALAVATARTITTFLFGVEPLDPVAFAAAGIVLAITAAVAVAAPALRAARVDPVVAFRAE